MRPVILKTQNQRRVIDGSFVRQYLDGGAKWAGSQKVHLCDGKYYVLDAEGRCEKCREGLRTCTARRLDALRVDTRSVRSTGRVASPTALTQRDIEGASEGRLRNTVRVQSHDPLRKGRPIDLPEEYISGRIEGLVDTADGLSRTYRSVWPSRMRDNYHPKGNEVWFAFRPEGRATSLPLVRELLSWIEKATAELTRHWIPTAELLDSTTQELKKPLSVGDLIRLSAENKISHGCVGRPPHTVNEIWNRIGARIHPYPFRAGPDLTNPNELEIWVMTRILQHYLQA